MVTVFLNKDDDGDDVKAIRIKIKVLYLTMTQPVRKFLSAR